MRTYGVHGGEQQLSRLFSGGGDARFPTSFFFLYRDPECRRHFARIADLTLAEVLPIRLAPRHSLAMEMGILLLFLPFIQLRLLMMLRQRRARICLAHGVHAALSCWLAALILRGTRFVYVHRGTKSAGGRHALFRLVYKPYDVLAGVSKASADSLRGLSGTRIPLAIENGIDSSAYAVPPSARLPRSCSFVFGSVGRLIAGKGHRLMIEAFARFRERVPGCQLWLAGDGSEASALAGLAESLGVAGDVRFLGRCDDVRQVLWSCDAFVFASESEGLSNSVLEAMACALPSVVVDAPGVSECHVDGTTGLVVTRNADSLADAMLVLASDEALRRRLGDAARQRVKDYYSIDANRRRFMELYQSLMERNTRCAAS
jgi:glycosyltransferase involved in cell wall biosynthesis